MASFLTQADALFRKNLTFQRRNWKTNMGLVIFPVFLCVLLVAFRRVIDHELNNAKPQCGCACVDLNGDGKPCETVCGIRYSTPEQANACPVSSPSKWPPLLQVPRPESRAVRTSHLPFTDLPDESCKTSLSCPATVLVTGRNRTVAENLAGNLFKSTSFSLNLSDYLDILSNVIPGTKTPASYTQFIDPAFDLGSSLYLLQSKCGSNSRSPVSVKIANQTIELEVKCAQGLALWRDSSSVVNNELFKGYRQGNAEKKANEFIAAYDFRNSNENGFNLSIWYNSTYNNAHWYSKIALLRVPRSVNLASNAYLKFLKGTGTMMQFEYVKEMPKVAIHNRLDLSSFAGALFFTWIIQLLFPVILIYLVYEKQQKLKLMMKMHGLKDGPYWMVSYVYFLSLSSVYTLCLVIFGSVIVIGYIYVFASGLLGVFLLRFFIEDTTFPRGWILLMEFVPGFSLYRGFYEFAQYSFTGDQLGTSGMRWRDLNDGANGLKDVLAIMILEWVVLLPVAFYLDKVSLFGGGGRKGPLFFLQQFLKMPSLSNSKLSLVQQECIFITDMESPDASRERKVVEQLLLEPGASHAIICHNLQKIYPGRDGNPDKIAVRGLSLALPQGECFGMLGPNGAGKTSFINMMIGLHTPTSGIAYVQGLDIRTKMGEIYGSMGVCPQHDLLWEKLTGREHLLFYGRLKNLKGAALMQAVEESLKTVNLLYGGVADKQARTYSGGMKRRLSVAISLIGDPKVVYMDEPSTGLDPASRNELWNIVKHAKRDRAILLTTHSMEEAEFLCDRLVIFVGGSLQCLGNPKELRARYGGSFVLAVTTSPSEEGKVENLARQLSPSAKRIYHIPGTQKFELPKEEVRIADVFRAVESAKSRFTVQAWGLADTTLEDVFIKVARGSQ